MSKNPKFWEFMLIIVAILWGTTFIPVKLSTEHINVFSLLFWRFLGAGVLMHLTLCKFNLKFDKKSMKFGFILAVLLFLVLGFQTYGLKYTLSSTVAFITGLNLIIVPFVLYIFFSQKIKIQNCIGAITALVGLYYLSGMSEFGFGKGEFFTLLCAICDALFIVYMGRFVKVANVYGIVVSQFYFSALIALFLAIFSPFRQFENSLHIVGGLIFSYDKVVIFTLVWTILIGTIFAFFVQSMAQRYVNASKTVLIFALEPVSAGFIGYFIGGEILTLWQIFGAAMIIGGVIISSLPFKNRA